MVSTELQKQWTDQLLIIQKAIPDSIVYVTKFDGSIATVVASTHTNGSYSPGQKLGLEDRCLHELSNNPELRFLQSKPYCAEPNENEGDQSGFNSFLGCPVSIRGKVWGLISIVNSESAPYTKELLQTVSVFKHIFQDQIELYLLKEETKLRKLNSNGLTTGLPFQSFVDAMPSFVFVKDADKKLLFANEFYTSFINSYTEIQWDNFISAEQNGEFRKQEQLAWHNRTITHAQCSFINNQGNECCYYFTFSPMLNSEKEIYAMGYFSSDISQRAIKEKESIVLKQCLEFSMNAGKIAFLEFDINTGIVQTSKYFKELTGFDLNRRRPDLEWIESRIHPDELKYLKTKFDRLDEKFAELIHLEIRFLNADQEYIWLNYSGHFEFNERLKVKKHYGILHDITKTKTLLEDITCERNNSLESNQAKCRSLANMSHEIRTPMNAIIGFSDLLSKHINDTPYCNYIKSIKSSGKILLDLINDLLDVSKIEAGKMRLKPEPTNYLELVGEIKQAFSLQVQEKGLRMVVKESDNFPDYINIDALKVRQLLINLINNAIKYTHEGEIVIYAEFKPDAMEQDGSLIISITDTGIGVDKEKQDAIFESFVQDEIPDNQIYQGSGLGLAIVKNIVKLMDGHISLVSDVNKGSAFTILIPRVSLCNHDGETQRSLDNEAVQFNGELVLVVDDVESNRDLAKAMLADLNLNCCLAHDGNQVLEMVREFRPALILLDIMLPGKNGFEVLKQIRNFEMFCNIPIIAVSAYHNDSEVYKINLSGFDGFCRKPFDSKDLQQILSQFLVSIPVLDVSSIQDVFSSGQSSFSMDKKEEVKLCMNSCIIPLWESLKVIQPSDKMKQFSNELKQLSAKYNWMELAHFQKEIEHSIGAYDFGTIQKLIKEFTRFIALLQ